MAGTWENPGKRASLTALLESEQWGLGHKSLSDSGYRRLLHTAAVVAQDFTFLAQVLRVLLALVGNIQAVRLL